MKPHSALNDFSFLQFCLAKLYQFLFEGNRKLAIACFSQVVIDGFEEVLLFLQCALTP